jgi:anti-sigma factor RsiW
LFDELMDMTDAYDQAMHQAIATISQSDPLIKLLQQVALGRMKPTDAGLRAVTDAWLKTYRNVLETTPLDRQALLRLDPRPRIAVLLHVGVLDPASESGLCLQATFEHQLAQAKAD